MGLFFMLFIFTEIYVFFEFVGIHGFFMTLGAYLVPSLLGYLILKWFGSRGAQSWQKFAQAGAPPGRKLIQQALIITSGVLLLIPMVTTRVLGLLLFLPGSRHLLAWSLKSFLEKKMSQFQRNGFSFNARGFSFGSAQGFKSYTYQSEKTIFDERDVSVTATEVIDVTAKSVDTSHYSLDAPAPKETP